jgi:hypothetical protein
MQHQRFRLIQVAVGEGKGKGSPVKAERIETPGFSQLTVAVLVEGNPSYEVGSRRLQVKGPGHLRENAILCRIDRTVAERLISNQLEQTGWFEGETPLV